MLVPLLCIPEIRSEQCFQHVNSLAVKIFSLISYVQDSVAKRFFYFNLFETESGSGKYLLFYWTWAKVIQCLCFLFARDNQ